MLDVVTDAKPHRGVHRQGVDVGQGRPPDVGRFAASRGLAAGGAGGQDDGELLADLAVAGVDVPEIGLHAGAARTALRKAVLAEHNGRRGLEGARRGHHQDVFLQRHPQPVPVLRTAQQD
jgi:hypothetical protein